MATGNKNVAKDEASVWPQNPQRLPKEVITGIEMKSRLDTHYYVESVSRKVQVSGVHLEKLTMGRILAAPLNLPLRDVDTREILRPVDFR